MDAVLQSEILLGLILPLILCTDTPCDEHTIAKYLMVCRLFTNVIRTLPVSRVIDRCTPEVITRIAKETPNVTRIQIQESYLLACADYESPTSKVNDQTLMMIAVLLPRVTHITLPFGTYPQNPIFMSKYITFYGKITSRGVTHLAKNLPHLRKINLGECRYLGVNGIIELVNSCSGLEKLDVSGSSDDCFDDDEDPFVRDAFTNEILAIIASSCNELEELDLSFRTQIDDLTELAGCPRLKKLRAEDCKRLKIGPKIQLLQALKDLTISGRTIINDSNIGNLLELPHLKKLDISRSEVTDDGIKVLATGIGSQLTDLNISHCNKIGLRGYEIISEHCSNLESLRVHRYGNLGSDNVNLALDHLTRGCAMLKHISICKLTSESITQLKSLCKLETLGVWQSEVSVSQTLIQTLQQELPDVHVEFC